MMFQVMKPVGCVTRYAPGERLETVRNELRTLRGILLIREMREKGGL
jgi:hypothetical protein